MMEVLIRKVGIHLEGIVYPWDCFGGIIVTIKTLIATMTIRNET